MPGDDGPAQPITSGPSTTDADANTQQAVLALRRQFRSTTYRPVGLTTGSRLLMSLTDRLEWLRAVVDRVPAGTADRWSPHIAEMVSSCEEVLVASADVLAHPAHRPTYATRQRLATARGHLHGMRQHVHQYLLAGRHHFGNVRGPPVRGPAGTRSTTAPASASRSVSDISSRYRDHGRLRGAAELPAQCEHGLLGVRVRVSGARRTQA